MVRFPKTEIRFHPRTWDILRTKPQHIHWGPLSVLLLYRPGWKAKELPCRQFSVCGSVISLQIRNYIKTPLAFSLRENSRAQFVLWIGFRIKWRGRENLGIKTEGQEHFSRDSIYSLSDSHRNQWPKPMMREGETGLSGFRASLSESSDSKDLMVCFHSWGDKRGGHFMNRFSL